MSNEKDSKKKKVWTDAERLELAEKLDRELEDYINSLEKRSDSDGWPEDCWREEMEKHPFFMSEMPENPTEMSPLVEGLQQLKYNEEYNTPNELAESYKEDGNFNYKHKKYRLAILSFSKGISTKCEDIELLSQLYNNRALAQLKLKNYRSSLGDCKKSIKLKPDYLKALYTAVKCCFYIKEYDQCIDYCNQILKIASDDKDLKTEILSLRAQAAKNKKIILRDSRLQESKEKRTDQLRDKIIEAIKSRKINIDNSDLFYDSQCHVHLNETGILVWPVIFIYPENNQSDLVQNFNETTTLYEQLIELFKEAPAWDPDKRYQVDKLNVYFKNIHKKPYRVKKEQPLKQILQNEKFIVCNGTVTFFVLLAGSSAENYFLKS